MLHTRNIMITAVLASLALGACVTDKAPVNGSDAVPQISVATAQTDAQLRSVAPGVSVGEYANQHVVYVSDKAGAEWLLDSTQKEYNTLFEQYTQSGDASVLPRLSQLQSTLQAAEANSGSPFVITSTVDSDLVVGPGCTGGDGSSCTCSSGCVCISADRGCGCQC